jgi:hypothetical protein
MKLRQSKQNLLPLETSSTSSTAASDTSLTTSTSLPSSNVSNSSTTKENEEDHVPTNQMTTTKTESEISRQQSTANVSPSCESELLVTEKELVDV